ncbi:MAG: hypothetical protein A2710_03835 [Burkholderiales bacterium RIFCSPHIGHO2_01_FULL_64_960]|nr:MAG: hypothetical protein A2710_03835 [Burkholderiales bacterium RIFCSPHIGHO2_01_FULL_64_960]
MAITLTYGSTTLELPEDLLWVNEFRWSAVAQSTERSLTGALLVDAAPRVGGRLITLAGSEDSAWILRSGMETLLAWAALPEQQFTLTHNGVARTVIFDHGTAEESGAIKQVEPVIDYSDPEPSDYYCSLELNFLEV